MESGDGEGGLVKLHFFGMLKIYPQAGSSASSLLSNVSPP